PTVESPGPGRAASTGGRRRAPSSSYGTPGAAWDKMQPARIARLTFDPSLRYHSEVANIGYLQVTRDCNQHCRFCSNPPSGLARTLEEDKRPVDDFVARRYEGVILTGGEPPLLRHLPD